MSKIESLQHIITNREKNHSIGSKHLKKDQNTSNLSKLASKYIENNQKIIVKQKKYKQKQIFTMSIQNKNNNYINFSTAKTQPQISRIAFPYFLQDDQIPEKQNIPKRNKALKVTNRVFVHKNEPQTVNQNIFNKIFNEEPPINQFLCYELSKQINNSLFDAKLMAQQIKKIKQQKIQACEDRERYKPKNKIRITKTLKSGSWPKNQLR